MSPTALKIQALQAEAAQAVREEIASILSDTSDLTHRIAAIVDAAPAGIGNDLRALNLKLHVHLTTLLKLEHNHYG